MSKKNISDFNQSGDEYAIGGIYYFYIAFSAKYSDSRQCKKTGGRAVFHGI